jgi:hypothetical protein
LAPAGADTSPEVEMASEILLGIRTVVGYDEAFSR